MEFPPCNAHIEVARDASDKVIGVTVALLVLTDDVKMLPEMFRQSAQAVLYDEATKN